MPVEQANLGQMNWWEMFLSVIVLVIVITALYFGLRYAFRGLRELHKWKPWIPAGPDWAEDI